MGIFIENSISNNTVTVNGKSISVTGNNVNVINGKIFVDGKEYKDNDMFKEGYIIQNVTIEGNVETVDCGGSVAVNGNVDGDIDCGGSVRVEGNHKGSIDCGGSVRIGSN